MSLDSGSVLGHYEIRGPLGAGGMGAVYRAHDRRLGRQVALKLVHDEASLSEDRRLRFEREARLLASLNHVNIATLFAFETADEVSFLVMELVEGETLAERIERGAVPADETLRIFRQIALGLEAAHERGVVHRDLKPGNVKLGPSGREVKILDFGLAMATTPGTGGAADPRLSDSPTLSAGVTRQGMILGTAAYMSPQQARGAVVDARTDLWAFGVCLFETLTGTRPFDGRSHADLLSAILRDEPPPLAKLVPGLPTGFEGVIETCLQKDPERRFTTVRALRHAIERLEGQMATTAAASGPPASPAPLRRYRTPLVGRSHEVAQLRRALESAASGRGTLLTLSGEAGVGKTRLASSTAEQAAELGFLVLTGHCYEGEGARPFSPWVEIVETSTRALEAQRLRDALGAEAPEIAQLYPGLRRLYPDLPPSLEMPAEAERNYLFDCFCRFVERLSAERPLLLVLEDLHWADESSLHLLRHLVSRVSGMYLVVVGTYRDLELDLAPALATTLRELVRERLVQRIHLARLTHDGVREMIESLSGLQPPENLVGAIHAETEGNPFFVEEIYEHLAEEGRLFDGDGEWLDGPSLEDLDVPEGVRLVVGRRLERLGEEAREALTLAAVVGRRFSYSFLGSVFDDPTALLGAIEEASSLHLIEAEEGASTRDARYQFGHELIRQTLLQELSLPRRQQLHLQIADAMESTETAGTDEQASALAHHLYEAGTAAHESRTFRALFRAGELALETRAFGEALPHFERALSLTTRADRGRRAELHWQRGLARRSLGRWEEALADWETSLELSKELDDRSAMVRTASETAFLLNWKGRPREAAAVAKSGLDLVGRGGHSHQLLAEYGRALSLAADLQPGLEAIDEALELVADSGNDPRLRGDLLVRKAYHLYFCSLRIQQTEAAGEAVELLRSAGDLWNMADAAAIFNWGAVLGGTPREADRFAADAEPLARRLGHMGAELHGRMGSGQKSWIETGDIGQLERTAAATRWRSAEMPTCPGSASPKPGSRSPRSGGETGRRPEIRPGRRRSTRPSPCSPVTSGPSCSSSSATSDTGRRRWRCSRSEPRPCFPKRDDSIPWARGRPSSASSKGCSSSARGKPPLPTTHWFARRSKPERSSASTRDGWSAPSPA